MTDQPELDFERRKWMDPTSKARFSRKEAELSDGSASEGLLEDIFQLCDQLFDHLSVLEQFDEVTSRGAKADARQKADFPSVRANLARAQLELRNAYTEVCALRTAFVDEHLKVLNTPDKPTGLKLHIGSGGHILEGWVNIDAGGDDLALNVNWGLPFADESVSFVYAAHVLEHLRYRDQAPLMVREVYRILKLGGTARFVVPDIGRLLDAYVRKDTEFFAARQKVYPLLEGFLLDGVASLDYILLFCGASSQTLNYNHKFGYDCSSLSKLLLDAGFETASHSSFQASAYPELLVDDHGYNAVATNRQDEHFSLFVEATK